MKILFVITGLGMGGAESLVVNLADYYQDQGHKVAIAYAVGDAVVKPKSTDIKLFALGVKKYADFFSGFFKLKRVIADFSPDVVHSHMIHANLLSRLVRIALKFPRLICTAHNTNEGGKLRMLAYRLTDCLNDISTNVSQEAVDSFEQKVAVAKGRMVAIPNGIDTKKFNPNCYSRHYESKENIRLIAVGRLAEQKDYPNLICALSILLNKGVNVQLTIVGDGALKEELINLSIKNGVLDNIRFLGIRKDVPQLLLESDIFVLSSSFEGFGLVVAEAMACERIVVATDCGGVKEVVGDCGFLVEPQNSQALAEAIQSAIELTVEERRVLGVKARARVVEKFSLQRMANDYMRLYQGKF